MFHTLQSMNFSQSACFQPTQVLTGPQAAPASFPGPRPRPFDLVAGSTAPGFGGVCGSPGRARSAKAWADEREIRTTHVPYFAKYGLQPIRALPAHAVSTGRRQRQFYLPGQSRDRLIWLPDQTAPGFGGVCGSPGRGRSAKAWADGREIRRTHVPYFAKYELQPIRALPVHADIDWRKQRQLHCRAKAKTVWFYCRIKPARIWRRLWFARTRQARQSVG